MALRKIGPRAAIYETRHCPLCHNKIKNGHFTVLVELFPADQEEYDKKMSCRPYMSQAVEVHWDCLPEYLRGE